MSGEPQVVDFPQVGTATDGGPEVVQIVMHEAFYNAHFVPLLRQQGFELGEIEAGEDEMRTFVIGLGRNRERLLRMLP